MADNTTLNPGTLGDVIATDDISGVKFQRVKLVHGADGINAGDVSDSNGLPVLVQGDPVSPWPSYHGATETTQRSITVDDYGALVTRGAVTTDEGTFRVNFANTSLAVSIGSVTVSGTTVTGSGFLTADANLNDYFKLDADGESAWTQIASVDSNTQLTLVAAYPGGTSGAASRSLVQPITAAGATISVASGQCTLASGTTSGARAVLGRQLDYAPMVWRSRLSISQRIANQSTRFGFVEFGATVRWFARFKAEGTTNTTLICESARNPTVAPSAAETESTTITLPNGLTTASLLDYRVEMLTESVRFYVNNIIVAEHTRSMPGPHDILGSGVLIENTGTAASTTSVVVDYITGKSHNKLEIGVMSDAEKIISSQAPVQEFSFSQAGVIAINTNLLVIDCSQLRSLSIQCASLGTSGVVTPEWSNDPAFAQVGPAPVISTTAGAGAQATFNAAGVFVTNVYARYLRLRLSTATTAGTTTLRVAGFQHPIAPSINTPVSGVAGTVTTSVAAGTAAIGDVGIQVRANATGAMSTAKIVAAATTNATSVKASAGRVFGWQLTNTTAAVKVVRLYNLAAAPTVGTSVPVYNIVLPANAVVTQAFPAGIAHTTGISYAITNAIADLDATAVAANDVLGAIFFA